MDKFVRPVYLFKGDNPAKARALVGEARRFLVQTLSWNRQKYFKLNRRLDDGSIIQIQRLMNDQFITTIIPAGAVGKPLVLALFLTEIDISDIDNDSLSVSIQTHGQGRFITKGGDMVDAETIHTVGTGTDVVGGNVDWRDDNRLISWTGPYTRYQNNNLWYSDFTASTLNYNNFTFGPQGNALVEESIDVDYDFTFDNPDPPETRTVTFKHPIRAGTQIYADGAVLCDIDDITPPTFPNGNTGRFIAGAGYNKDDVIVMVKYINWVDNFHLYTWNETGGWTLVDTIDLSETDRVMPGAMCTFCFNSTGTSCATITKTYEHTTINMTDDLDFIGEGETSGADAYYINEEDKVRELFFTVDGSGSVTGFSHVVDGAVVNYRITERALMTPLNGQVTYHGADYVTDSLGVETMETIGQWDDDGVDTNSIRMAGQTIETSALGTFTLDYPVWSDIRFNIVVTQMQDLAISVWVSPGFRLSIWRGDPAVETVIRSQLTTDGVIYPKTPPASLMRQGNAGKLKSGCHQTAAVSRDGTFVYASYLRFIYVDIDGFGIPPGDNREFITHSTSNDVSMEAAAFYKGQVTVDPSNKRLNAKYDYTANQRKFGLISDIDVAICPL